MMRPPRLDTEYAAYRYGLKQPPFKIAMPQSNTKRWPAKRRRAAPKKPAGKKLT